MNDILWLEIIETIVLILDVVLGRVVMMELPILSLIKKS